VRAFADDLATILSSLDVIPKRQSAFRVFSKVSGLTVKPKKCFSIPLGEVFGPDLVDKVRSFLASSVPSWQHFSITDKGKYLGFVIGPGASLEDIWRGAAAKREKRFLSLAASKDSPALGIQEYNSRAFSCLGYISQLYPLAC